MCGKRLARGAEQRRAGRCGEDLFAFAFGVELEDSSSLVEVEEVSVDDKLPPACVGRGLVDAFDGVTLVSKLLDEKIDVYHGDTIHKVG